MLKMMENVLKNLVSKPATRMYPIEKREPFKGSRGHIEGCDIEKCIFCGICQRKCPANAIAVNKAERSWEIDQFKCVICNACVDACPKKCITSSPSHKAPQSVKEKYKTVQPEKQPETTSQTEA